VSTCGSPHSSSILRKSSRKISCLKVNILVIIRYIERYTEIERENRILLEKMTHIMQTTTATSGLVPGPNEAPVVNHNGSINRGNVFTPGGNNQHQVS
jgi:hypothetical protein